MDDSSPSHSLDSDELCLRGLSAADIPGARLNPLTDERVLPGQKEPSPVHSANLPVVTEADASPEIARLYTLFRENFARPHVPGILQCFATHPPLLEHMMGLAQSMLFTDGALGRKNKELLATFVSSRNQCDYCADSHGSFLRMHGGSPDLLAAAMTCDLHSASIDANQAALLRFVQKVTDDSQSIQPADIETLRSSGWTDLQIAETIHLASLFACFNRVVNAFGLPPQGLLASTAASSTP
jgi:uncharacterized peroxidase-related enzyme